MKTKICSYEVVLVQGHSATGESEVVYEGGPVWYPVLPMAWDNDVDSVLATVATAFLLLLPMQIRSKTLLYAAPEKRRIVLVWALLVFAGLICALINSAYVYLNAVPQVRFCPVDKEDILPLNSPGVDNKVEPWDGQDWHRWNRTVTKYFVDGTGPGPVATKCFYPCLGTSWPLRESSDINVVERSFGNITDTNVGIGVFFAAYLIIGAFTISSLTVAFLVSFPSIPTEWRPLDISSSIQGIRTVWYPGYCEGKNTTDTAVPPVQMHRWGGTWRTALRLWVIYNLIVAKYLAPVVTVGFLVSMEWLMWNADPGGESFRHVG